MTLEPYASGEEWALYAGDCLDVLRKLPDDSIDVVCTDPPYCSGGRNPTQARGILSKSNHSRTEWFLGDNMGSDTYLWWMREVARQCVRIAKMGSQAQVFTDWRQYTTTVAAWESVGWTLRNVLVWDKARGGAMGSYWRNNHEWVCIFSKGKPRPLAHRSTYNTWTGTKPQGGQHPTEKPVDLMRYLLSSVGGGAVLDPFAGSGTTGVAALAEGMEFVGIDHEPAFVDIAAARLREAAREAA